ncbi:hypothetical protein [Aquitalea aquatilis]|uniref:hypothetical protein n=1 Tax=Aquitalea aquatilis TaxID=1537400 RepID=UPI0010BDF7C5|nr:hypothetical protein [Aquitalea aquatilis]
MKDFDLAYAVEQALGSVLGDRVTVGDLIVKPEDIREPASVIHLDESVPEDKEGMAVRNDQVDIRITTLIDAEGGQVYSRIRPHQMRLRKALFATHNLNGVLHIISLKERRTLYQFNRDEMVYMIHLDIRIRHRRAAEEP